MAGFGAAHRLHQEGFRPKVYDKNSYFGGHTASFRNEKGFLFDIGPHISFTKDDRMQKFLADAIHDDYDALQINLSNYWQGLTITHPVQLHLNALPKDLIIEIIKDFLEEQKNERSVDNYEQWLIASYGKKFAENFPMQYTRKYHLTEACNMSTDWLGPRMYRPSIDELLRGALGPWQPDVHYITHFRYPKQGGFYSYLQGLPAIADLHLNSEVVTIDPVNRALEFENGETTAYEGLVSSVPLDLLIPMIKGVPADVRQAANNLACSTCVLVNVGVAREDLSDAHMTYFYDADICFTRLSFPHMLSPTNVPPGHGSIQAEVYFSKKYKPLEEAPDVWIDRVIADLIRSGVLREDDEIVSSDSHLVQHANIIFDLDRERSLATVHGYLDDIGIHYCGRYGDWGYMWTDESFMSGEAAASRAMGS
jgi:protoporphyrinogen oxidase